MQLSKVTQTLHNATLKLRMYFTREHVILNMLSKDAMKAESTK